MSLNIAIDLDGTLAEWEWGNDEIVRVGKWLDGAKDALAGFLDAGHHVIVHTCRATWEKGGGTDAVAEFLRSGPFEPLLVYGREMEGKLTSDDLVPERGEVGVWIGVGKPLAHVYIDDRGWEFRPGEWPLLASRVEDMHRSWLARS